LPPGRPRLPDRRRPRGRAPPASQVPVRGTHAMKVTVSTTGSLAGNSARGFGRLGDHIRYTVQSAATVRRMEQELAHELQAVAQSERAADPEFRRDALERAVRRVWGATQ